MKGQPDHLRVLDGLRGLAILLVVLPHVEQLGIFPGPALGARLAERFAHGVEIFFVLSGFCLTYPLLLRLGSEKLVRFDLATFYVNRVWRIVPLYVAATLTTAGVAALLRVHDPAGLIAVPPPGDILRALLFLDHNVTFANATLWSVPVQVRWYLAFPLLLWAWLRAPRLVLALIGAAWVAYAATRVRTIDLGVLPLFLLGIVAADLFVRRDRRVRWALPLLPLALVAAWLGDHVASFPDPSGADVRWTMQPTTIGWQLAAFCFVLAATSLPLLGRLLSTAPLRFLGLASFSIYLTHEPVIVAIGNSTLPQRGLLAVLGSIAVGFIAYALFERPLTDRALRRRIRERVVPAVGRVMAAAGIPEALALASARYRPYPAEEEVLEATPPSETISAGALAV